MLTQRRYSTSVDIIFFIIIFLAIIIFFVFSFMDQNQTIGQYETYCACCEGEACVDVYYNYTSNQCIKTAPAFFTPSYPATNTTSCYISARLSII